MNINFTSTYGCKGAVTLTNTSTSALPVSSVLWHLGDGNSSATTPVLNYQYPNTASSYLVSLILNDGVCTDSLQQAVSVDQLNANFTYSGVCVDNPALFNDATVHSQLISKYTWNFGNGLTADYYDPITYYQTPGSYTATLSVIDAAGCTDMSTQNITVNQFAQLNITAGGPTTFCQGSSVQLSLPPGYLYYWNNADTAGSINVSQGGNYFAWVQDGVTGCSGFTKDTISVVENIPPAASILDYQSTQLCSGGYIYLTAIPYSNVTYQWYVNGVASGQTSDYYTYSITGANSGSYQLVITDGNGCKDTSATLNIQVNPTPAAPVVTQNPAGNACSGTAITLSVSGTDLYEWSNGFEGDSIKVFQAGSFSVQAFNSFGCSISTYTYINLLATPDLSLFPTGCYQICQNSDITINGPSGMQTYLWSNGTSASSITLSASGTYSLSVTGTDGCSASSQSFNVDVFNSSNITLGNDTTICAGQKVVLDAGAYPVIKWQDGSTSQFYTVTDSGEYSVTVTNSSGCTSSDSIHVAVRADSINLGNDTTVCSGNTVVLNAGNSFVSYLWQDGSTGQTFTVTQSGTYNVSAADQYGCTAKDTIQVTIRTDSINLGKDTTICKGKTVQLIVSGSYSTYLWQNGSTNPTFTVTQNGTYHVSATDAYQCTVTDSIIVTVRADSINLGNDTIMLCPGSNLLLQATDSFKTYVWQNGSNSDTFLVTQAGVYDVLATDSFGCTATDTVLVQLPGDYINLGNDTTVCSPNIVVLSVTGNYSGYQWQNGTTASMFTVAQTGLYSVSATDQYGCTVTDSIQVTIRADSINLGDDTTLCLSNSFLLQAAGSFTTYLWQDGSNGATYLVTQTGIYDVLATDAFGCTATDTITVQIPHDSINLGNDTTVCSPNTVILSVIGNYSSYVWQNGSTASTFTVSQSGLYQVNATDPYGCTISDTVQVTVRTDSINLGSDTSLCNNEMLLLQVSSDFSSYLWQNGSTNASFLVMQAGLYFVKATDQFGCSASDTIMVSKDSVSVSVGNDTTVCTGTNVLLVAIGNFTNITWQDGSTGNSYLVTMAGLYIVRVSDNAGCRASDTVTVSNYPVSWLVLPNNLRLCDSTVTIAPNDFFSSYLWNNGSTASSITVSDSGTYFLTVSDMNGCTASDSAIVHSCDTVCTYNPYFIPNAFSPNGQGANGEFKIFRKDNTAPIQGFAIVILNRWGEKMYESHDENSSWDGKYKGQPAPPGVYSYELKFTILNQTQLLQGTVTMMR